jgi:Mg2+-importing ATPase
MFVNSLLGFFQEFRASRASEKLLNLIQNKVYVFRSGGLLQVPVSEVVVGDIVHLSAGSVAPVDVQVIESQNAFIDDSMRTGETLVKEIHMGENLFSGAIVSSGKIVGNVIAVGENSSIHKYRSKLEGVKKWSSFSLFTERVIKYVFSISLIALLVAMFFLVFMMGKYSLITFFVFAIAMLVGVVPEMLPLIIMIILTRESITLSKERVIVKRLSALSSLGAVQFLLTDKTGTITENKLRVAFVSDVENFWEVSNSITSGEYERSLMDSAYDEALEKAIGKIHTRTKKITHFEPFDRALGYETFTLEGGEKVARGIIQNILELGDKGLELPKSQNILRSALEYEKRGMRVSALSYGVAGEWVFAGFVAYNDPIKSTSLESLKIAHERGVSVKILTGDTALVAMSVAEELHLIKSPENIISLDAINVKDLTDKQLIHSVVFAKCTPENKLELMDRFLKLGPVAFLGDGINDALALKRADIGIAVDNASDIAKESADVILLEKDLRPVLASISLGRKALRNILTYIMYTLSGNAGTFFSLLIASFFYPVLPMLPIQILLNNLLTDLPLMLIITDNPDEYALRHVPHFEPKNIMKRVLAFGLISSFFDLAYFQLYKNATVAEFQTGWFILSILAELALIISIRSSRSVFKSPSMSVPLVLGVSASLVLPFFFVYTDTLSKVFKFTQIPFQTIIVLLVMTVIYIVTNEVAKYFMRRKNLYNKPTVMHPIFK